MGAEAESRAPYLLEGGAGPAHEALGGAAPPPGWKGHMPGPGSAFSTLESGREARPCHAWTKLSGGPSGCRGKVWGPALLGASTAHPAHFPDGETEA